MSTSAELYSRFGLALVFVVALIGLVAWIARRYTGSGPGLGAALLGKRRGAGRRVGIVETTPIDAKRRLVLVRRDGVEHLLLLGPGGDLVVERGIGVPAGFTDHLPEAAP